MLVPMLKMAVKMLDGCNKDKIDCARTILEEIIVSMEKKPAPTYGSFPSPGPIQDDDLDPEAMAAKEELA